MIIITVRLIQDIAEINSEESIPNDRIIYLLNMIRLFKNLYKMSTKNTKYISYTPGPA